MPFKRYVEIGRLAVVNYGADYGKLVTIVDVVDQQRVCSVVSPINGDIVFTFVFNTDRVFFPQQGKGVGWG